MGKLLSWPETEQANGRPVSFVMTFTEPPWLLLTVAVIAAPLKGKLLGPVKKVFVGLLPTDTVIPLAIGMLTVLTILGAFALPVQVAGSLQLQFHRLIGAVDKL